MHKIMKKVEIYRLNGDGTQSIIALCSLKNDKVICEGDADMLRHLHGGIEDPGTGDSLFEKDGVRFLSALKSHFKSGYLLASDVLIS